MPRTTQRALTTPKTAGSGAKTATHKAPAGILELAERPGAEASSIAWWALLYLTTEVYGLQSPNTADAKSRDLDGFLRWYLQLNRHLAIDAWWPRDTQAYLDHLEREARAPATINRALATLRHFARWAHDQAHRPTPFGHGLPTKGVKELVVDEREPKKLTAREIHQLQKAADALVLTETHKTARPRRNRAIFAVLYYTGMRVSELCNLDRAQYDGQSFLNVRRKGRNRTPELPVVAACREVLGEYLELERPRDDKGGELAPLFLGVRGTRLTRTQVGKVLGRIANEANKHRKASDRIHLHPHRLRHTAGAKIREQTGSDYETAAYLGHATLKYVGMYGRPTQAERRAALEHAFRPTIEDEV